MDKLACWILVIACCGSFGSAAADPLPKRPLPELASPACERVKANLNGFPTEQTTRTTQYFTPLFKPGPDGGLREQDRDNCLKMEGACIVGKFLYNADGGAGTRFELDQVKFVFGQGSGASQFNKTNALFPCRTIAAATGRYPIGTVIVVPSFQGKVCPQNGKKVDGCFVVADVGSAIQGQGRFDFFTGECSDYDGNHHFCRDGHNADFNVPVGTTFHVIARDGEDARKIRQEIDGFVDNGWKSP